MLPKKIIKQRNYSSDIFLNRKKELEILAKYFLLQEKNLVQIYGGPGIGKTSLAINYAQRYRDEYSGGIYHTNAFEAESVIHMVYRIIPTETHNPFLLIINDAEKLINEDIKILLYQIRHNLPMNVIITTRLPFQLEGKDIGSIELGPLSEQVIFNWLHSRLFGDISKEETHRLYEIFEGNPSLFTAAWETVLEGKTTWNNLISEVGDFNFPGLIGLDGRPLLAGSQEEKHIVNATINTNEEILSILKRDPSLLYNLTSRKFEEIIAELLLKQGFLVELTPFSKDGGFDMYAAKKDGLGSFLYLVECKRYNPPEKVGVSVARSLYGVIQSKNATAGVIVTSSFFTKGAKEFQKDNFYQLHLHDYLGIQDWLKKYVK
jgi:restriction system protein